MVWAPPEVEVKVEVAEHGHHAYGNGYPPEDATEEAHAKWNR